jgi:hypothetical protein
MPIVAEDVIPSMFLPELAALRQTIFGRILPAFDGLEMEAEQIQREALKRLQANANEYSDAADLAEAAFEAGLEHYELTTGARQIVINALVVALSHLFEQQRHLLTFPTLLDSEPDSRKRETRFFEFLKANGVDRTIFNQQTKLEELDLVANVAKHAEGRSADCLRALRQELFVHPSIREYPVLRSSVRRVNRTLMGTDLFVQPEDLRAYFDAVEAFWKFVLDQLSAGHEAPCPTTR